MNTFAKTAMAGLALLASAPAWSQSSVELYGVVDEFVQYTDVGGPKVLAVNSSGLWGSRVGLRGSEDLGGGLKANFLLENGFVPNTGALSTSDTLFSRQAWVGLSGNWGEVKVGRQYSPLFLYMTTYIEGFNGGSFASGLIDFETYTVRTNNTITYFAPVFAGLQLSFGYGLGQSGNGLSGSPGSSAYVAFTYSSASFNASGAYQEARDPTSDARQTVTYLGGNYVFDKYTVFAGVHTAREALPLPIDKIVYTTSLRIRATDFFTVSLGTAWLDDRTHETGDAWQVGAMCQYAFSKRTIVYGALAFVNNHGAQNQTLNGSAVTGVALAEPGANPRGVQLGITHFF
jgi:predicted porin